MGNSNYPASPSISLWMACLLLAAPTPLPAADPLVLEKYKVTGSHVRRADLEGIVPLAVFDRERIERSGATTINEFIRDVVINTAGIVDEQFTQGFAPGAAGIDLRGLGINRTLVLLDGRRLPIYPYAQDGFQSFVDINGIPLAAIERIEVLKDGASAIYGADAVAGVVNLITRKDAEGFDGTTLLGVTGDGDGETGQLSAVAGKRLGKTRATIALEYLKRNEIKARDRDLTRSANGPIDDRSLLGRPGTGIPLATGLPQADANCNAQRLVNRGPASFCSYDFAPWVTLIPETERIGLFGSLEHELTDNLRVFGHTLFNYSRSERDLAPTNNAPNLFFVGATNPTNPLGQDMVVLYRMEELGARRDVFKTRTFNFLAGLAGHVGTWDWETAAGYGRVEADTRGTNGYAAAADLQAAVDAGTLNLFGASPGFDPDSVAYTTSRDGESELYFADLKATGEAFEMAFGPAQLAMGAEIRHEKFHDRFDSLTASGAILGIGGTSADGDRNSRATYAELVAPVADGLELQLAGRFDHYSDFGGTFNPKLGLRWQPRSDLLVRISAGTGFKAPALHELYSGEIQGFESLVDNGVLISDLPITIEGNPDLDAEDSRSVNLGVVWDITSRWDASIDGWYLKNEDAVINNPQYILDNEDQFPNLVTRDGSGNLESIRSPFQNVGEQRLWGVDLDTEYRTAPRAYGAISLGLVASYLGSFERQPAPGQPEEELAGKDGRPRWRAQANLDWARTDYQAGATVNYVGSYERRSADDDVDDWITVDARFKWAPSALKGGAVSLGIDNLFDQDPPKDPYLEGWPFFNRALHDPRGRFFYLRYERQL